MSKRWTAKCWMGSASGYVDIEVSANTINGAKEQLQNVYGAEQIVNLREISNSSSSSGSSIDGAGTIGLVGLAASAWAFVTFTPWILMILGGAAAIWIGEKITGQSIQEYTENENSGDNGKAAIVLALALFAGGFGFVKGDEIKKGFDAPSDTPAQVQSK